MLRFLGVLLVTSCCLAADLDLDNHWKTFKLTFKKSFNNEGQENKVKAVWETKVKAVLKHNVEADLGQHSYKQGINQFTGMARREFESKMLGLVIPKNVTKHYTPPEMTLSRNLPQNFDWRSHGVVTRVKDQGSCSSCWAFATTGATEGALGRKTGKNVELSEQQLVDCRDNSNRPYCAGGWPNDAFQHIKERGIVSAASYPYEKRQEECRMNNDHIQTHVQVYYDVPKDENSLQQHLVHYGPISICLSVNDAFAAYSGGIFDDPNCRWPVNHAVLLVGYGTENGKDYWTIKNSWGDWWGERGYIRIARNKNNMCSLMDYASFPLL